MLFLILIYYAIPSNATSTILIVGDSLSAGYGLSESEQWPALLVKRLQDNKFDYTVINASVSGATTKDGLKQFPQLLKEYSPQIVILALGSNDGLRGQPLVATQQNLGKMIDAAQDQDAEVLLIGFRLPLNYGKVYGNNFAEIYTKLSDKYDVSLVPFLLAGFAEDLSFFQSDRLHPTAQAQPIMLDNVWPYLEPMLKS